MSKKISRLLMAALALIVAAGLAGILQPANAAESDVTGDNFLSKIVGEYQPLFEGATYNKEYDHYWNDYTAAVVGKTAAADTVAYLKASVGGDKYGPEANPGQFFCGFIGAEKITFGGTDGKTVTFTGTDGAQVTHEYAFVENSAATGTYEGMDMAMDGYLYQATDDKDDEYEYLLMFPDTPDTTYHLEFRYAPTKEEVTALLSGARGSWVASAIPTKALTETSEEMLQNVISLFVVENLAEMANDETNAQRAPLNGVWDFDTSAFPEYANTKMFIALDESGAGRTWADMTGKDGLALVSEYIYFAYDNDAADGKDAGVYLALNEAAETVTPGGYEIVENNGVKTLKFTSAEGNISYIQHEGKLDNDLTVQTAAKNFKVKKLKKKAASFEIGATAYTPVTYTVAKNGKKFVKVNADGKVTVKKGTKKGTYKVTVNAAESGTYNAASAVVTIKVK